MRTRFPLAVLVLATCLHPLHAQAPRVIAAQGSLKDAFGAPVADGSHSVTFTIYNLPSGTFSVTNENQSFTSDTIQLNNYPVVSGSETVFGNGGVTYTRGTAYTIDYTTGIITRTAGSAIPAGSTVGITYQYTGRALWTETQSLTTAKGLFATALPSATALAAGKGFSNSLSFADQTYYLGVKVGSDPEMTPRIALNGVPYALALPGLRTEPGLYGAPNLIGGFNGNVTTAPDNTNFGNVIAGGGLPTDMYGDHMNKTTQSMGFIGGGFGNTAGHTSVVGGGSGNQATGNTSTIGGGGYNLATGAGATIAGGYGNAASGLLSTVAGGGNAIGNPQQANRATDDYGFVGGGQKNQAGNADTDTANAPNATVGGGFGNTAGAAGATVPGGQNNQALGKVSFAAGNYASALHDGSFVWSDDSTPTGPAFTSTAANQFLIRASGNVGVNLNNPMSPLAVAGSVTVDATGQNNGNKGTGFISNGLMFGGLSGEGIGSNRTDATAGMNHYGLDFYTGGNGVPRMSITNGGQVGIGTRAPTPGFMLDVIGALRCTSLTQTSSRIYKVDIQTLGGALDKIGRLRGVSYRWTQPFGGKKDIGLIAEEVGAVVPEVVAYTPDGKAQGVDYGHLDALLVEGIKDQQKEIASLRAANADLAKRNSEEQRAFATLAARLDRLEKERSAAR